jgi:hypothetical protein
MASTNDGNTWIGQLVTGGAVVIAATTLHSALPGWAHAGMLAFGGLSVIFGSCAAMIKGVEGLGQRLGWNEFVAGTMAGLASNVPELVMLAFVLAKQPRIGFIVTMLTLHVGALAFGLYCLWLPRDGHGDARLPEPLVKLSTDLYAAAAGVFLGTGLLMVLLNVFDAGQHKGEGLGSTDLYVLGGTLLVIEAVAVVRLVQRFAAKPGAAKPDADRPDADMMDADGTELPSWGSIAVYGVVGVATSIVGGHAVGDFAEVLVAGLSAAGYSEMVGALILSIFAASGAFVMIVTAHAKGTYDIALASASGQINQVPFVVLPVSLILIAVFADMGVVAKLPHGGVLPIDLGTTSVVLLAFPPMLMLWKSVQDDGKVNWVETASLIAVFALTVYFLAAHG